MIEAVGESSAGMLPWLFATPRGRGDLQKACLEALDIPSTGTNQVVLDLPGINLALSRDRTAQAVRSLIEANGLAGVRMSDNLGDHGVYIEDRLIYPTAA
jgi:hypothetical protein